MAALVAITKGTLGSPAAEFLFLLETGVLVMNWDPINWARNVLAQFDTLLASRVLPVGKIFDVLDRLRGISELPLTLNQARNALKTHAGNLIANPVNFHRINLHRALLLLSSGSNLLEANKVCFVRRFLQAHPSISAEARAALVAHIRLERLPRVSFDALFETLREIFSTTDLLSLVANGTVTLDSYFGPPTLISLCHIPISSPSDSVLSLGGSRTTIVEMNISVNIPHAFSSDHLATITKITVSPTIPYAHYPVPSTVKVIRNDTTTPYLLSQVSDLPWDFHPNKFQATVHLNLERGEKTSLVLSAPPTDPSNFDMLLALFKVEVTFVTSTLTHSTLMQCAVNMVL